MPDENALDLTVGGPPSSCACCGTTQSRGGWILYLNRMVCLFCERSDCREGAPRCGRASQNEEVRSTDA